MRKAWRPGAGHKLCELRAKVLAEYASSPVARPTREKLMREWARHMMMHADGGGNRDDTTLHFGAFAQRWRGVASAHASTAAAALRLR